MEGEEDNNIKATAFLVKVLSYTNPSKAEEYVGLLQQVMDDGPEMNGKALESMEIPRFAKKALVRFPCRVPSIHVKLKGMEDL